VTEGGEHATVEQTDLVLYLLGALEGDRRDAFERHLAGCDKCLDEAEQFGRITSAFPQLTADDLRIEAPQLPAPAVRRPWLYQKLPVLVAAAAAVIAAVIITVSLHGGGRQSPVLTAKAEASTAGVSLSVVITPNAHGATAKATVTGLEPGVRYRMYVVTRDGATHVVRDWTGAAGAQSVTGEVTQPVDSLAFFTIGYVDGAAIVTAPVR
jgi:hypothetical protein